MLHAPRRRWRRPGRSRTRRADGRGAVEAAPRVRAQWVGGVRLRVEFTTAPFDLDEVPPHAVVARDIVQGAPLDSVDVGPFGNTAEGGAEHVLAAVHELLRESLEAGATRVS